MNGSVRQAASVVKFDAVKAAGWSCGVCAFILILLMTGCAHKQADPSPGPVNMKDLVHKEIADPARAEKVLALMAARFKMKEVMTPGEWKAVFSPQG